jgi:hypothetical protein
MKITLRVEGDKIVITFPDRSQYTTFSYADACSFLQKWLETYA